MSPNVLHARFEGDGSTVRLVHEGASVWTADLPEAWETKLEEASRKLSPASEPQLAAVLTDLFGPLQSELLILQMNAVASRHAGDARSLGIQAVAPEDARSSQRSLLDFLVRLPWELALDDVNRPLVTPYVLLGPAEASSSTPGEHSPSRPDPPESRSTLHVTEALRILCVFADAAEGQEDDASPSLERRRILESCLGVDASHAGDVVVDWLQYGVTPKGLAERLNRWHCSVLYLSGTQSALDQLAPLKQLKASQVGRPHLVVLDVRRCKGGPPVPLQEYDALAERLVRDAQVGAVISMRHSISGIYSRHLAMSLFLALFRWRSEATVAAMLREARVRVREKETEASEHDVRDDFAPIVFAGEAFPIPSRVVAPGAATDEHRAATKRHRLAGEMARKLRTSKVELKAASDPHLQEIVRQAVASPDARPGFVGRRTELRELHSRWLTDRSRAPVAILSGPLGIGKSWLAAEVIECWYPEFDCVYVQPSVAQEWSATTLEDLLEGVCEVLGIEVPGAAARIRRSNDDVIGPLVETLTLGNILVVLDEVDERCADLLRALCRARDCKARVLVTAVPGRLKIEGATDVQVSELGEAAVDHFVDQFPALKRAADQYVTGELRSLPPERVFGLGPVKHAAKGEAGKHLPAVLKGVLDGRINWRPPAPAPKPAPVSAPTPKPAPVSAPAPKPAPMSAPAPKPSLVSAPAPAPMPAPPRIPWWRRAGSLVTGCAASVAFVLSSFGSQWPFTNLGWRPAELRCGVFDEPEEPVDAASPGGDAAADASAPLDAALEADAGRVPNDAAPDCGGCSRPPAVATDPGYKKCTAMKLYCPDTEVRAEDGVLDAQKVKRICETMANKNKDPNPTIAQCATSPLSKGAPGPGVPCDCR